MGTQFGDLATRPSFTWWSASPVQIT